MLGWKEGDWERIVGRKTGRLEKDTLALKNIREVR